MRETKKENNFDLETLYVRDAQVNYFTQFQAFAFDMYVYMYM